MRNNNFSELAKLGCKTKSKHINYQKCDKIKLVLNKQSRNSILQSQLLIKMNNVKKCTMFATIFLFICNFNVFAAKQLIVEHPQNTTARIGDTVILKCRVENQVI